MIGRQTLHSGSLISLQFLTGRLSDKFHLIGWLNQLLTVTESFMLAAKRFPELEFERGDVTHCRVPRTLNLRYLGKHLLVAGEIWN